MKKIIDKSGIYFSVPDEWEVVDYPPERILKIKSSGFFTVFITEEKEEGDIDRREWMTVFLAKDFVFNPIIKFEDDFAFAEYYEEPFDIYIKYWIFDIDSYVIALRYFRSKENDDIGTDACNALIKSFSNIGIN